MESFEAAGFDYSNPDPIRMSVVNALLAITTYRANYPSSSVAEAQRVLSRGLASATGHAYADAGALLSELRSLDLPPTTARVDAIRIILRELVVFLKPGWARLIPHGRAHVAAYASRNAIQCLSAAGLYDEHLGPEASNWWDVLSSEFRSSADHERTIKGREGERLTIQFETRRLTALGRPDLKPKWVALDDNSLGYDVLSFQLDAGGRESPFYIEAKATTARPLRFFISHSEWQTAGSLADAYAIYVWDVSTSLGTRIDARDLDPHLPENRGDGRWVQTEVIMSDALGLPLRESLGPAASALPSN